MILTKLSKFIVDLDYEDIPETAIEKAKTCFLDFLGVANRGFFEESVQIAIKSINEVFDFNKSFDNGKCSIIGNGYSNVLNAGFINAVSSHALDLDDGHRLAQLHPGTVIFPSALAVSEVNNITGKKFLEGIICGYEIAIVLGMLVNPYHRNQGFHSTGTIGTFAVGAAVSKILNLDLKKTINALGLCGTQSSGFLESDHQGTMGKQLHAGRAVSNGILSTYLAKNGFTGAESIVDGDEGFLKAMSIDLFKDLNHINKSYTDFEDYLSSYLEESIGKFHIKEVYLKKYPFCRHLHSSIDATLNIINKYDFNFDNVDNMGNRGNIGNMDKMDNRGNVNNIDKIDNKDNMDEIDKNNLDKMDDINNIEKIVIKTYKIAVEHNNFNPKNKEEIKQSLPYAIAVAILENSLNLDFIENNIANNINTNNNFTNINNNLNDINNLNNLKNNVNGSNTINNDFNGNLNDNLIKKILEKIVIEEDEEYTKLNPTYRPSKVIIEINNEAYEDFVKLPLGEVENPLSKEDILEKFKNINPTFDFRKLKSITNHIDHIEDYYILDLMKIFN
jgi:2-methylcitrate dehydratase PrpD